MTDDDVIKNPMRGRRPPPLSHYQTERERLGIEPVIAKVDKSDFMSGKKTSAPKQIKVSSGQNEDLIWSNQETGLDKVNSEMFTSDNVPSPPKYSIEESEEISEEVSEDEKKYSIEESEEVSEEVSEDEKNETFTLYNLKPGEYIIIVGNNVVENGSFEKIKSALSDIVLEKGIDIDDCIVLKRAHIKAGIFIEDVSL